MLDGSHTLSAGPPVLGSAVRLKATTLPHSKIPNARRRFPHFSCHLRRAMPQKWSGWTKLAYARPMNKSKIMNTKHHLSPLKLALIVGSLALPLITQAEQPPTNTHPRYKLIDLGTLGGPGSRLEDSSKVLNNAGTVVGEADTSNPDVQHAFRWQKGVLTDLGALPGGNFSHPIYINDAGLSVGFSDNGVTDRLTASPEINAVLWNKNGEILNLGTLGGASSAAVGINNGGQVVGFAANTTPDPFSLLNVFGNGSGTQTRAFLWENGAMRDLGTLGGPDSVGFYINERGQIAGLSYTDSTPNDTTGLPTYHPFLWDNGRMFDLGNFGGTFADIFGLNNRGQVAGNLALPGDELVHPFFWDRGTLTDIGTFGGPTGEARWLNELGEVVGVADFPTEGLHNAFHWKNGVMTDLGNLGKTSVAHSINSKGQIVGGSRISFETGEIRAFLYENGGPMIDLNTLVPAGSSLKLVFAESINDRGEIVGAGAPPGVSSGDAFSLGHAFLLIPVGEE